MLKRELIMITVSLFFLGKIQVPKLASAAEYFFKIGVEGKRFRPTVRVAKSSFKFLIFLLLLDQVDSVSETKCNLF